MKKRIAAFAACLLLMFQLAAPPAEAARSVYFVAAEENVLPVTDDTMPFWHGGYLYISSTIFTGIARKSLGIGQVTNNARELVVLYSGGNSLFFEVGKSYASTPDGDTYYPGAVEHNGTIFVPASVVAKFFDLQYSITEVSHGYLVWLREPGSILTDRLFADAASGPMNTRYDDYLKSLEQPGTESTAPGAPEDGVEFEGESVYLCLKADEKTETMLNALDSYGAQAAFFCTPSFMEEQGGLLRRMTATGQSIGILVDAASTEQTVEEQLEAGNRALERAAFTRTRLAMVENGGHEDRLAAENTGYRCLLPDLDRSGYSLRSGDNATNLLQRISSRGGDVTVWLADTASASGLRAFLYAAQSAEGRCLALTETA